MLLKPGLYIVSTPIGHLDDITLRALEVLKKSQIILCEDTRISQKLLAKHGITAKLQVYNDHSDSNNRKMISKFIDDEMIVCLISDAGTPLISDPGYKLIRELKEQNYHIDVIPGVSSPIAALTLSGLPTDRFLFAGFLPKTCERRKKIFEELAPLKATLIFFETSKRLIESLDSAYVVYGNRQICVARELTKLHQEARLGLLLDVKEFYIQHPPKGEIVLLISGEHEKLDEQSLNQKIEMFIKDCLGQDLSPKDTTKKAFEKFGNSHSKKEIYRIVNKIKETLR